jgi:hypothetical protein
MAKVEFGWFAPPLGIAESNFVPLAIAEQEKVLPEVVKHFDSFWVPDHLYAFGNTQAPFLECWTTITWLLARYPNMKAGPIVLAVGFRHPPLLAKMAASLQALSGGRFIMGIGAGWREEEYKAYGYDFPPTPVRVKQLEEAVTIMRMMWTERAPTFKGEHFHTHEAYCYPQHPIPIMIGARGEKLMLPLIARVADIWDIFHGETYDTVDLETYRRKRDILHEHMQTAGREPGEITQSISIGQAKLPNSPQESQRWVEHLGVLVELGLRQFILDCGHVTSTEPVTRFAEEVMPTVKKLG